MIKNFKYVYDINYRYLISNNLYNRHSFLLRRKVFNILNEELANASVRSGKSLYLSYKKDIRIYFSDFYNKMSTRSFYFYYLYYFYNKIKKKLNYV